MSYIRPAFVLTVLFTLITGVGYPLAITGIAQVVFPVQANGSLLTRNGVIIGSSLIGQSFVSDRYFHGRPSATSGADPTDPSKTIDAPYNAASSTGSNLGPSSKVLLDAIAARAAALGNGPQPADLIMASASGLDPHISEAGASVQVARIAKARNMPEADVRMLVTRMTEGRELGIFGEKRVNVLALNMALDTAKP